MGDRAQWQVAGSAPEVYELELVPAIFEPWARRVVGLANLQPGDRVLDLACGTGVVARIAAEEVGERGAVVAADLNPGMIAVARSLPAPRGATIEWREADAGALPFRDQAFDAALCQLGLQFFADRSIAMREMCRVLRPGGRVVVMVWRGIDRAAGFAVLAAALEQHIGPEAASTMRAPFRSAAPRNSPLSSRRRGSRVWISESRPAPYASRRWRASWRAMSPALLREAVAGS